MGGFRSVLPLPFSLGGGTLVPVAPLATTNVTARALASQLDIRREITQIRNGGNGKAPDQNLAKLLTAIQDYANTTDQRLRDVSGSVNSIGLTRDPSGNVVISGATFTVRLAQQNFSLFTNDITVTAPNTPVDDSLIDPNQMSWSIDEIGNSLLFRVRYSDGTYHTGTVALV